MDIIPLIIMALAVLLAMNASLRAADRDTVQGAISEAAKAVVCIIYALGCLLIYLAKNS